MFWLLANLFASYFKIGLFGFGGGYAMIALMEHEIIKVHGWMSPSDFVNIIAVAEMTPGPIAINSATFVGYQVAGLGGAAIATLGVVFPSLILIMPAARLFLRYYTNQHLQRAMVGIQPAVIALIGFAAFVVGESAIIDLYSILITLAAFLLLFLTKIHPLLLIGLGALSGIIIYL